MQTAELKIQKPPPQNALSPIRTAGPLPKSDSIQSLVSLMNCTPHPIDADDCSVRGVDGEAHTHSVDITEQTDTVALSGLGLETLLLDALALGVARDVREVSLAANSLHTVQLAPLASCQSLVVLTLNSNCLSSIDLQPLASCPMLQRLWLHDNRLETIDLTPLATCKTLRSLYLEDNSLHNETLDLTPLANTHNLRSLRLGGNRLGGKLDLTPLFQCPALSVFNIDTSVSLEADGDPSMARTSSALRRVVLDIEFTGNATDEPFRRAAARGTSPSTPPRMGAPPGRPRRRTPPSISPPHGGGITRRKPTQQPSSAQPPPPSTSAVRKASPIVKILLIGFRRLARYGVEDRLSQCGKVMIRAAHLDVATRDPGQLLDSHLVLVFAPTDKTLRQVTVVAGRIPITVVGSERYRSTADNHMLELLDRFHFYVDPMSAEETKVVFEMGQAYASGKSGVPSMSVEGVESSESLCDDASSPVTDEDEPLEVCNASAEMRKSHSETSLPTVTATVGIELEHIEDEDDNITSSGKSDSTHSNSFHRSRSVDDVDDKNALSCVLNRPAVTWSEVTRKLTERRNRKVGRGWGSYLGSELSAHGKNKLRAERAAVEVVFSDLDGYATSENCAAIARACGLPKCAGPTLFRAAFGSSFDIESTTPEAGVPNIPLERKHRRISMESFLAYWDSRLKAYDGEERLSNILEDSHHAKSRGKSGCNVGHSEYGAPLRRSKSDITPSERLSSFNVVEYVNHYRESDRRSGDSLLHRMSDFSSKLPADLSCPCDAGIEALITSFMEGRSSRFGSFALVKMCEAIAIGSALVMYSLRGMSRNRVGGHARPVCPKEVRDGKLNAALIAAEVGIFEGVASGLSMDQIRSVKGCFATEASPGAIPRSGIAVDSTLSVDDVKRFCTTRKTLMPGAVERVMATHCRDRNRMTLSEFAILLSVVNNISSNGAVDYFFTVVDVDHDERWTLPDLRQFHMEKEKMWLHDGLAVSDLSDLWVNLVDMIRPANPSQGFRRKEFCRLGARDRKVVLQSLLFLDDDHSLMNVRRTMELSKHSSTTLAVM